MLTKYLIISDTNYWTDENHRMIAITGSMHDMSASICATIETDEPTAILLNIESLVNGHARNELKALDILFFLRCVHRLTIPVVCVGFEPLTHILHRKPEAAILSSPSTRYLQLPITLQELAKYEIPACADVRDIVPFVRSAFNVDRFRHRDANWWGVKCMWDIHVALKSKSKAGAFVYPENIQQHKKDVNTAIASFIYGHTVETYSEHINSDTAAKTKLVQEIHKTTNQLISKKRNLLYIDDCGEGGWTELFVSILFPNTNKTIEETKYYTIISINEETQFIALKFSEIKDEAMLTTILFDTENENIIDKWDWDLIIIDLQLFPQKDEHLKRDFNKLSGAVLLDNLRWNYKEFPVMIISASNKIWSYKEMMKLGADAFWTKEGVDDNFSLEESVDNYRSLMTIIGKLTDEDFGQYKTNARATNELIKNNYLLWWGKEVDWSLHGDKYDMLHEDVDERTVPDIQALNHILENSLQILRSYLHNSVQETSYHPSEEISWHKPSLLIQHLAKIVEIIHDFESHDTKVEKKRKKGIHLISNKDVLEIRGDKKGADLYKKRNKASHYRAAKQLTNADLWNFYSEIINYLKSN